MHEERVASNSEGTPSRGRKNRQGLYFYALAENTIDVDNGTDSI